MLKTYEFYLIKLYLKKILTISLIFLCLIFILSIFDEISFFKKMDSNFFLPFILTALNTPSTLFEIFPFIFLISTQFFFIELIDKNELEALKVYGLNNFRIIKILFLTSLTVGIILISFFYHFSSKLKFLYFDVKNGYSSDNKYLAVFTDNGLWIKDEIDEKIYIINAFVIEGYLIKDVTINEFDNKFELIQIIKSPKVNISKKKWIILNPTISKDNKNIRSQINLSINTHFDHKKINRLFKNLTSLNILELLKLKKDYKSLGYSTSEIESQLSGLLSFPVYLTLMSLFASIIMFNIKRNKPIIFHIILGIFLSVLIYYFYYLFNLLGITGKIPIFASIWLPFLLLTIFISIGLVRINEK
jgi:lipopolysaccharide export system permease protein